MESPASDVDQAMVNWADYRSEALRNIDQMKGHIAQAGQQRAERQTERQVAGATQELAAARAWAAKLEKDLHSAQREREESRAEAETLRDEARALRKDHKEAQKQVVSVSREAAAVRAEAMSSARECAELALQVAQLEEQLQEEQQRPEPPRSSSADEQLAQAAIAVQALGSVLAAHSAEDAKPLARAKPWDSPASALDSSVRSQRGARQEPPMSVSVLVDKVMALREEKERAEATCKTLNRRLSAALQEQKRSAEALQKMREASARESARSTSTLATQAGTPRGRSWREFNAQAEERAEAEQEHVHATAAAVQAALGAAAADHVTAMQARELQWEEEKAAAQRSRELELRELQVLLPPWQLSGHLAHLSPLGPNQGSTGRGRALRCRRSWRRRTRGRRRCRRQPRR